MHKIYIDDGSYNIIYQIPQILYSALISGLINALIKYFSLSEKIVLNIKQEKDVNAFNYKSKKIQYILIIKFTLFFILTLLFLLLFAYYIICFCGIYINTQTHLIKDTIISFISSFVSPFFIYIIPGIFRMWALLDKNKNKKCLYNFSKFLQLIL